MKKFQRDPFSTFTPPTYPSQIQLELFEAILSLKNKNEAVKFFRDLLTTPEINEFANRWQMVKMLIEGKPYTEIASQLKTSTTTVTRVAYWLFKGMGGYKLAADRILPKKKVKPPTRPFKLRGKYTFIKNPNSM